MESAEKVLSLQEFGKQYKTIGVLLETLFHVSQWSILPVLSLYSDPSLWCTYLYIQEVEESLGKIEKSRYSPGMPFPESRELQEGTYVDKLEVYYTEIVVASFCRGG